MSQQVMITLTASPGCYERGEKQRSEPESVELGPFEFVAEDCPVLMTYGNVRVGKDGDDFVAQQENGLYWHDGLSYSDLSVDLIEATKK